MLQLSHAATKTPRGEQPALGSPQHAQYHRWRGTCVRQTQVRDLSFERDQAEGVRQVHVSIFQMVSLAFSQNLAAIVWDRVWLCSGDVHGKGAGAAQGRYSREGEEAGAAGGRRRLVPADRAERGKELGFPLPTPRRRA